MIDLFPPGAQLVGMSAGEKDTKYKLKKQPGSTGPTVNLQIIKCSSPTEWPVGVVPEANCFLAVGGYPVL